MKVRPIEIYLVIVHSVDRSVDGDLHEIGRVHTVQLCVQVTEQTALKQRIVGKANTANNVTRVEGNLLRLRKVVVNVAVQYHLADTRHRNQRLGNNLGRVQEIKVKLVFVFLRYDLYTEFPFWIVATLNSSILSV